MAVGSACQAQASRLEKASQPASSGMTHQAMKTRTPWAWVRERLEPSVPAQATWVE